MSWRSCWSGSVPCRSRTSAIVVNEGDRETVARSRRNAGLVLRSELFWASAVESEDVRYWTEKVKSHAD